MKFVPVPGTQVLFCIHDTRKGDYRKYAAAVNGVDDYSWKNAQFQDVLVSENDDHPVVNVSWQDAKSFCAWLSQKEGRSYRLPKDHEWSIAVGIGALEDEDASPKSKDRKISNMYPWGTTWPPPSGAGNFSDGSCKMRFPKLSEIYGYQDGFATTSPVMSFQPNQLGLYDLGGNVWQWCEDWYDNEHKFRVLRGGSWDESIRESLLSSRRFFGTPNIYRNFNFGFRCVLSGGALKIESTSQISGDQVVANQSPNQTEPGKSEIQPPVNTTGKKITSPQIDSIQNRSETFVRKTVNAENSHDLNSIMPLYAEAVNFFDKGLVNQEVIRKDKEEYFQKWPIASHTIRGGIQSTQLSNGLTRTEFATNFHNKGLDGKVVDGTCKHILILTNQENHLVILDEKSAVTKSEVLPKIVNKLNPAINDASLAGTWAGKITTRWLTHNRLVQTRDYCIAFEPNLDLARIADDPPGAMKRVSRDKVGLSIYSASDVPNLGRLISNETFRLKDDGTILYYCPVYLNGKLDGEVSGILYRK